MTGHKLGEPVSQDEMDDCYQGGSRAMTAPVESVAVAEIAQISASAFAQLLLKRRPHAGRLIESRDAAMRKAAWREAMGALQLIEVDLEAGDLPARDRVAMALVRTKAWLKHFAAKAKEPTT